MKMGLIGTGVISSALASLMAGNGVDTVVVGRSEAGIASCLESIHGHFGFLMEQGKVSQAQKDAAMKRITFTQDYADLAGAVLVEEAVGESVPVKHEVYAKIEAAVDETTIITSATSALMPDVLCENMTHKERFIVAHPFQPAHLQPMTELVPSEHTSDQVKAKARYLYETVLKRQVVSMGKAAPGFVVNRFQHSMFREGLYMVEQGIASAEDIDKAIHYALGLRYGSIGLFEYFDDVGFELHTKVGPNIYPHVCASLEMPSIVAEGIAAGKTGRAAGQGMHDWTNKDIDDYQRRKVAPFVDLFDWDLPVD